MITTEKCESCKTRDAERAVECPQHGRHLYCDKCNKVIHKVEELHEAIKEDIRDRIDRGEL